MQLDIFDHGRDLMLRNDVLAALSRRDLAAARSARQDLQAEYPDDAHLPVLALLIEAQAQSSGPAFEDHTSLHQRRQWLHQDIAPAARRSFDAPAAAAWLAGLWGDMAQRAVALPFRAECSDDHAAALWLQAGDWPATIDTVARIQAWRRTPAPLSWMTEARWRHDGVDGVWSLLAELAWLSAEHFDALTRRMADPIVNGLRQRFEAEFEADEDDEHPLLAWFPAWVLTAAPALAPRLGQARPGRDTAPERGLRLLLELIDLERQGRLQDSVPRRAQLRTTQAALYTAYLKTR